MSAAPASKIYVPTTADLTVRVTPARSALAVVARYMVFFVGVVFFTFVLSSLVGQILLESARSEAARTAERAKRVEQENLMLRKRVDASRSLVAVQSWAESHGFVMAGARVPASAPVASPLEASATESTPVSSGESGLASAINELYRH
ncbi:MAG: hypothetical protein AMXMBFR19_11440 [Chthonomonadaceae bacterium]